MNIKRKYEKMKNKYIKELKEKNNSKKNYKNKKYIK